MKITVGNCIYIENYNEEAMAYCQKNLEFANPEFIKKQRSGRWLGNTKPKIVLYERVGNSLILPFGCLEDIFTMFNGKCEIEPNFTPIDHINYKSSIKLFDYQAEAVEKALKKRNGVIVMPCGAGKTQTALELVARLGGRALWLTHTKDLMTQSRERARSCYGIPVSTFGTITSGKINIGTSITFATVQTMSKIDLSHFKDYFDIIIVDECHKCIGTPTSAMMFFKVVNNLNARYKIGITATPKRADGMQKCMYALLGNKIHEVGRDAIKCNSVPVKIEFIETGFKVHADMAEIVFNPDGTISYSDLINSIATNKERNAVILEELRRVGGRCLVLSDRVHHLDILAEELGRDFKVAVLKGSGRVSVKEKEARGYILKQLNDGEIDFVFATYALAKEGLDIPNLRYLALATPQKDETTVTQSIGRVSRKTQGKEFGTVLDFCDSEFGLLKSYEKKRTSYYKKLGYIPKK